MEIKSYDICFSVCKVADYSKVDFGDEFVFIGKTDDELSLVCRTDRTPDNVTDREDGWKMMRIQGVLDFSLVGILSKLSSILATERIGIFAVSTFNTDYILVKSGDYDRALGSLEDAGYLIVR